MKNIIKLMAIMIVFAGWNSKASAQETAYDTYCNEKFDYCIDYPTFLLPQGESGNGDGQKFISRDGKNQMLVYQGYRMNIETGDLLIVPEAFNLDMEEWEPEDYELSDKHYILWGEKNGLVYKFASIKVLDTFLTVLIEFDRNQKRLLDEVSTHVFESINVPADPSDEFMYFLTSFVNDCWFEKNFNSLLILRSPFLEPYIDPAIDIQRYYSPGAIPLMAGRSENFGFDDYDDFSTKPMSGGEFYFDDFTEDMSPCDLESPFWIYYRPVSELPDVVVDGETFEIASVPNPYPGAEIMEVYLSLENRSPRVFYFINVPGLGWKLAFVNDTFCSA